jgi:NADPH:quinone reductase-like Zn-dependent oxidoreductase
MSGVVLTGHGGPEMLEPRDDLPVPVPVAGEVLIKVHASAVNNTDINTRTGWYSKAGTSDDSGWTGAPIQFPLIQGIDVCGVIAGVGSGVDPSRVGERVLVEPCLHEAKGQMRERPWFLGSECDGGFAEYVTVAARHAHRIKSALTSTELATFPCSWSTAENMLTRAVVGAGDRVLVTGASGGVGSAAVQLAKARGAHVTGIAGSSKREALMAIGADQVIARGDNLVQTVGHDAHDVVIDLVAGPQWSQLLDCLRPFGRYAVSGAVAGPLVDLDVRTLYLKDLSLFGCTALAPSVFANLIGLIESGRVRPVVAATFNLRDIVEAQAAFAQKSHIGKIALTVAAV